MRIIPPALPTTTCKYFILKDYPDEQEHAYERMLEGHTSDLLLDTLTKAGIPRTECLFHAFLPRITSNPSWPTYFSGNTLKPEFSQCVATLTNLLSTHTPKIILALGAFSLWALRSTTKIREYRGFLTQDLTQKYWVLPTYSPHTILKDYSLRAFFLQDFQKAKRYLDAGLSPTHKFPNRTIHTAENLSDIRRIFTILRLAKHVAIDIETFMNIQQISTISFSPDKSNAYVIPLLTRASPTNDYSLYPLDVEIQVWEMLFDFLTSSTPAKIFHNAVFDLSHLWNASIPVRGVVDDTMILAHSLQPELPKSLAILGSTLCDLPAWKSMRTRTKDEEKVED